MNLKRGLPGYLAGIPYLNKPIRFRIDILYNYFITIAIIIIMVLFHCFVLFPFCKICMYLNCQS